MSNFKATSHNLRNPGDRISFLLTEFPSARTVLLFYGHIIDYQQHLYARLEKETDIGDWESDLPHLLNFFPEFLHVVKRIGSEELQVAAEKLLVKMPLEWENMIQQFWHGQLELPPEDVGFLFFPKAFLQPYAGLQAVRSQNFGPRLNRSWSVQEGCASCPFCGRPPQVSLLQTEGAGARRSLVCSLCMTEWRFKRVCCTSCGEETFARLGYVRSPDFRHIRLDLCESCKRYLKTIDQTVDGKALPLVDDVASLALDIWAVEQGYEKLELNLAGI